jgi:hypothetical protein
MLWLIEVDFTTPGKADSGNQTPPGLLNVGTNDAFPAERSHFGREVVAHQIEGMAAVFIRRVKGNLRRWQGEDQPTVSRVYIFET